MRLSPNEPSISGYLKYKIEKSAFLFLLHLKLLGSQMEFS